MCVLMAILMLWTVVALARLPLYGVVYTHMYLKVPADGHPADGAHKTFYYPIQDVDCELPHIRIELQSRPFVLDEATYKEIRINLNEMNAEIDIMHSNGTIATFLSCCVKVQVEDMIVGWIRFSDESMQDLQPLLDILDLQFALQYNSRMSIMLKAHWIAKEVMLYLWGSSSRWPTN